MGAVQPLNNVPVKAIIRSRGLYSLCSIALSNSIIPAFLKGVRRD